MLGFSTLAGYGDQAAIAPGWDTNCPTVKREQGSRNSSPTVKREQGGEQSSHRCAHHGAIAREASSLVTVVHIPG